MRTPFLSLALSLATCTVSLAQDQTPTDPTAPATIKDETAAVLPTETPIAEEPPIAEQPAWINGQSFILEGQGQGPTDLGDSYDALIQPVSGDFTLTGLLQPEPDTEAALLLSTTENLLWLGFKPDGSIRLVTRPLSQPLTQQSWHFDPPAATVWLSMQRTGEQITLFTSEDGTEWEPLVHPPLILAGPGQAGFAIASGALSHITITSPSLIVPESESQSPLVDASTLVPTTGTPLSEVTPGNNPTTASTSNPEATPSSTEITTENASPDAPTVEEETYLLIYLDAKQGNDTWDGSEPDKIVGEPTGPVRTLDAASDFVTEYPADSTTLVMEPGTYRWTGFPADTTIHIYPVGDVILVP